ncbi:MAG: host attachment protein [Bdellovibrionales bacterium]|nr:host attachment protein [Bdellovibrionales bacterium]
MTKTWTLIANRSKARLFEGSGVSATLKELKEIENPEGRLSDSEIEEDRPGRAFDSAGKGRHSMSSEVSPSDHVSKAFANRLADDLNKGRIQGQFQRIILVAEPQFLGFLRAALDKNTLSMVVDTVDRNLVDLPVNQVNDELSKLVKL